MIYLLKLNKNMLDDLPYIYVDTKTYTRRYLFNVSC